MIVVWLLLLYQQEHRQTFRAEYRIQIPLFIVANPFSKPVFLFRRTDFVKIDKRYFGILSVIRGERNASAAARFCSTWPTDFIANV